MNPVVATIAEKAAATAVGSVRVCRAGRIVRHYPDETPQSADVQLVHDEHELLGDGTATTNPAPIIYRAPVVMPAGGGRTWTFGLEPGDPCYAVFRDVDHDAYDAGRTSGTYAPADRGRRFDPSDVMVLPMSSPPGRSDGQPALTMGAGEALHIGALTAALALTRNDRLASYLTELVTWLATHVHPSNGAPPSTTPPSPGDLSTSRVKVDQ